MSVNRLNHGPVQRRSFDDAMTHSLVQFSQKLMKAKGLTKQEVIQYCSDRFDTKGELNIDRWVTDITLYSPSTNETRALVLKPGTILRLTDKARNNKDTDIDTLNYLVSQGMEIATVLLNFLQTSSFVIWRMYIDRNGEVAFGMMAELSPERNEAEGAVGTPAIISNRVLNTYLNLGIIEYFGDMEI